MIEWIFQIKINELKKKIDSSTWIFLFGSFFFSKKKSATLKIELIKVDFTDTDWIKVITIIIEKLFSMITNKSDLITSKIIEKNRNLNLKKKSCALIVIK